MQQLTQHIRRVPSRAAAPAILLFFLAPALAELFSGSAPPVEYFAPPALLLLHCAYGATAVLMREWAIRRGLNAWGRLVLALTMGIYIEGVLCKSFFSPQWPDFSFPAGYGRVLDVNWHWTVMLMLFHAVASFLIPWLIVDLLLPRFKNTPALNIPWTVVLAIASLGVAVLGFTTFPMNTAGEIYHPAWLHALLAWGVLMLLPWLAAKVPEPARSSRIALSPRLLGVLMFCAWLLFMLMSWAGVEQFHWSATTVVLLQLAVVAVALALAWRQRSLLTDAHRYALVLGHVWFWGILGLIQELDNAKRPDNTAGMAVVALLVLLGVYLLGWRLRTRRRAPEPEALSTLAQ